MKKLIISTLLIITISLFLSCSKDDKTLLFYQKGYLDGYVFAVEQFPSSKKELDAIANKSEIDYNRFVENFKK